MIKHNDAPKAKRTKALVASQLKSLQALLPPHRHLLDVLSAMMPLQHQP